MTPTYFVDFKVVATAFIHGSMTKDESKESYVFSTRRYTRVSYE